MAKYRANRDGQVNGTYIHAGEIFYTDEDRAFSWADRIDEPPADDVFGDGDGASEPVAKPAPKTKKAKGK
jgi:hypothetical protein